MPLPPLGLDRAALDAPLGTLLALAAGRTLLSFLPAGAAGSHAPARLPLCCALVALLGAWLWVCSCALASFLGASIALWPLALATALGIARWRLGPHELVPQHALEEPRRGWLARLVLALALGASALPLALGASSSTIWGCLVLAAIAWWIADALERAGRAPLGAALVALGLVVLDVVALRPGALAPLALQALVALAASAQLGWLRRADARERALALWASCALTLFAPLVAGAGLASCLATTHRNARRSHGGATLLAMAAVALPSLAAARQLDLSDSLAAWALDHRALSGVLCALGIATVAAFASARAAERRPESRADTSPEPGPTFSAEFRPQPAAPSGREFAALGLMCVLPPLLALAFGARIEALGLGPADVELTLAATAPALALFLGLSVVRARSR
ncbi:MAG: hypothetical protein FJ298_11480 [Planctomycetes bacterium]|nr:hypothetical protein [Planctomycetota bacterium]